MSDCPWLTKKTLAIAKLLLISYENAFNEALLCFDRKFALNRGKGEELFLMPSPVMAHDNKKDPCLIYVNAAALQLWGRRWEEMIGMPSRLTAPAEAQKEREISLGQAIQKQSIENYQGIRINSEGEKFMIKNARIWTLLDAEGNAYGQGATFTSWRKL